MSLQNILHVIAEGESRMKRIKIIFENKDLLVIDKPAGYLSHGDEKSKGSDVASWFAKNYPKSAKVGDDGRAGIVHRLDKDTSGVMLLAKTPEMFTYLKQSFETKDIEKTYLAITYGVVKDEQGMIDRPIGRSSHDARLRRTGADADGKQRNALTYYKVLERFPQNTYLEVHPKSGRTHQVRVHLKSIGKPILCDMLYAPGKACMPEMGRQALHASEITFALPNGAKKSFKSPLPDDFKKTLEKLRKMC
ncbi:MAG: RluA family pseudouridine synthase [Candidatus Paceibacterota bacterium]|jgi:23S rRNA pseudouridine1911/1915/1917 synthase